MKEQLSALMDGELDGEEARIVFGKLKQGESLRDDWQIYHLIGDSLRDTPASSADFSARFAERLAAEPTVLAPQRGHAPLSRPRIALAAAASLAAVSLVAWTALQVNQPEKEQITVSSENMVRMSSANVSGYVNAHQEYAGAAYYGATPYLRASVETRRGDQ